MKKLLLVILISFFLTQCDDGNFDTPSFVFENDINYCGDLTIFNLGQDDSEALILDLVENNTDEKFFKTEMEDKSFTLTNQIYYRIFNDVVSADYFCQNIPPVSPQLADEWIGSGDLIITNTIVLDDKDGIEETELELDTDEDDIFNYIDIDDDGDGILTINELYPEGVTVDTIIDADGDDILDYLDTDGDQTFNYLDEDDDNDAILTINENLTDEDGDEIPDYLDDSTVIGQESRTKIKNKYNLNYTMVFTLENMSLNNSTGNAINYSNFSYGTKTGDFTILEEE